jgi:hypothetical protein
MGSFSIWDILGFGPSRNICVVIHGVRHDRLKNVLKSWALANRWRLEMEVKDEDCTLVYRAGEYMITGSQKVTIKISERDNLNELMIESESGSAAVASWIANARNVSQIAHYLRAKYEDNYSLCAREKEEED